MVGKNHLMRVIVPGKKSSTNLIQIVTYNISTASTSQVALDLIILVTINGYNFTNCSRLVHTKYKYVIREKQVQGNMHNCAYNCIKLVCMF